MNPTTVAPHGRSQPAAVQLPGPSATEDKAANAAPEKPPLELKRVQRNEGDLQPQSGLGRYEALTRSVADIGPDSLDLVASFLSIVELEIAAKGEPAFAAAPLTSAFLDTRARVHAAARDRFQALRQVVHAERAVEKAENANAQGCVLPVAGGIISATAGAGITGAALAGAIVPSMASAAVITGSVLIGAGCLPILGVGVLCAKNAYDRRCANENLVARKATAKALRELFEAEHKNASRREDQLRAVDLEGVHSHLVDDTSSEDARLLGPR